MARRSKQLKTRKAIAVIGEGISEWAYFNLIRKKENYSFKLKPEKPTNSNYVRIFQKALRLLKDEYDIVFCLIDMDYIFNQNLLQNYKTEKSRIKKKVGSIGKGKLKILEQHPCFEIWFLLHYVKRSRPYNCCSSLISELEQHDPFTDYDKSKDFFDKSNLYKTLKSNLVFAIKNSKWLNTQKRKTRCNIHNIFQYLNKLSNK